MHFQSDGFWLSEAVHGLDNNVLCAHNHHLHRKFRKHDRANEGSIQHRWHPWNYAMNTFVHSRRCSYKMHSTVNKNEENMFSVWLKRPWDFGKVSDIRKLVVRFGKDMWMVVYWKEHREAKKIGKVSKNMR